MRQNDHSATCNPSCSFAALQQWSIHSEPLAMATARGHVSAVHGWTMGREGGQLGQGKESCLANALLQ